ncbi:hypothetical protein BKE30_14655 [Alkanindiges hydrocarboniclasticus]|uniref:Conjugal transfer protein TraB n=1 Tax=Alkanindiges hydrocarboniclasticus TaxID=1907941 RepID=A0A1S8CRM8_9GAMM|nr:TraB/VirB10 family protein [Alkanindiges hydrocarboniclasticus]ONG37369.1 hypothetical protein BKE30_14655 [Alkanindiges hydrocarboniclasticus]
MKEKFDDLKARWAEMDANDKRKYFYGIGLMFILIIVFALGKQRNAQYENLADKAADQEITNSSVVTPKVEAPTLDDLRGASLEQIEQGRQQTEAATAEQEKLREQVKLEQEQLKSQTSELASRMATMQEELRLARMGSDGSGVNNVDGVQLPPLPSLDDKGLPKAATSGAGTDPAYNDSGIRAVGMTPDQQSGTGDPLAATDSIDSPSTSTGGLRVITKSGQNSQPRMGGLGQPANKLSDTDKKQLRQSIQRQVTSSKILPTGSLLEGVLLTGMDAAASSKGQATPVPALIRVKKEAILPNKYLQDVRECFVVVSGFGDLASERARLRTENISCIFKDGQYIDQPISGYVVGEDGKAGMRGRVVERQGAIIGKSVLASFLAGFGSNLSPTKVEALDISAGSTTRVQRPDAGVAAEMGAYQGVGQGFSTVSQYYLDMANQLFPIIEIDAARKVTIVLTARLEVQKID